MRVSLQLDGSMFSARPELNFDDGGSGFIQWNITCDSNDWMNVGLKIPLFGESMEGVYEYLPNSHPAANIDQQFIHQADILKYLGMTVFCFDGSEYEV